MNTKSLRLVAGLLAAVLCLLFATACTSTTYTDPSGAKFSRTSFLNRQNIGKVSMQAGDKTLSIEGYSNDQTEIAAAVAGSVVKALVPALQPAAAVAK